MRLPLRFINRFSVGDSNGNRNVRIGTILFVGVVILLVLKALWGYWDRDLTYGDTSSYFSNAVRWHRDGQVNIVWSPLYTMYYGSWLDVTGNAAYATFLHRLGLIFGTTALIAWLSALTLPRSLALVLVGWWIALPIHYDTLYEVHLFGTLPLLLMGIIPFAANKKWKMPLLLGVALLSTVLIRNEYVIAVAVFSAIIGYRIFRNRKRLLYSESKKSSLRYIVIVMVAGLIISYFYSISYLKGDAIQEASIPKHTVNMCQVYASGYRQRNPEWKYSPWTQCSLLMEQVFGKPKPSLGEMVVSNPSAVFEHFLWNLKLVPAGIEVLLFNATVSSDNPDYVRVKVIPFVPRLLLWVSILCVVSSIIFLFWKKESDFHSKLGRIAPVLFVAIAMTIAIILTQRPRPSYLLGTGVLYIWVILVFFSSFKPVSVLSENRMVFGTVAIALLLLIPSYRSIPWDSGWVNSKTGYRGWTYKALRFHSKRLCRDGDTIAIGEYGNNISSYLCSPIKTDPDKSKSDVVEFHTLPAEAFTSAYGFITALEEKGVRSVIIDPSLTLRYRGLVDCPTLARAFLNKGWKMLNYTLIRRNSCIAVFKG